MEGCLQEKEILDAAVIQVVANNLGLDYGEDQPVEAISGAQAKDYGF